MSEQLLQDTFNDGEPGEKATIDTEGRTIRPILSLPSALVDETKVRFKPDEITIDVADPANVGMLSLRATPLAFDGYDVPEDGVLAGLPIDRLQGALSDVRYGKQTSDPVTLGFDGERATIEATREYDQTTVATASTFMTIDPDTIRQGPDLPDLSLPWRATVDLDAFVDVVKAIDELYDHIIVQENDGALVMKATGGDEDDGIEGTRARFDVELMGDGKGGETTIMSLDYLSDMATGLKKALVDEVTVVWGDEFSVRFEFERTNDDNELMYEGAYMLAPRISK